MDEKAKQRQEIETRLRQKLVEVGRAIRSYRDAIDGWNKVGLEPQDWLLQNRDAFEAQRDLLLSVLDGRDQFSEPDIYADVPSYLYDV